MVRACVCVCFVCVEVLGHSSQALPRKRSTGTRALSQSGIGTRGVCFHCSNECRAKQPRSQTRVLEGSTPTPSKPGQAATIRIVLEYDMNMR